MSPREANLTAMGTAGRAVLFAGGTVVISLLGMLTMGLSYLNGVAASAVLAVLAMLAASLTLLPAILGFVGHEHRPAQGALHRPHLPPGRPTPSGTGGAGWCSSGRGSPSPAAALVLLIITLPVLSLRLGFPDEGNNLPKETSRQAYDLLTAGFGPGFNGPLLLVADLARRSQRRRPRSNGSATAVRATDGRGVRGPAGPQPGRRHRHHQRLPHQQAAGRGTADLVHRLRDDGDPRRRRLDRGDGRSWAGSPPSPSTRPTTSAKRLPIFIGSVVLLSFFLLTTVFRSPLVALKAGIMNLLSIAAAYGVMSYAVQGTWLGDLLNIPETPIPAFVPMIMFAILFGLSMDYEVFLLSRIREEYLRTGDNGVAVADGLAATARVITAAAAIMVFVFGVFIFDPNVFIKQIGLGLTTAVLVDATIVRMVLVPATMELLGNANWWMPRWLDKLLPEVHIEGEASVQAELATLLASEELTGAGR